MSEDNTVRYLTIGGILLPDNRLVLQPGYLTEQSKPTVEDLDSPLSVELVDERGRTLLRHRIAASPFCADGATINQLAVLGKVPFPPATRTVRFLRDAVLIHEIEVPREKPEVRLHWEPPQNIAGRVPVAWSGQHPEGRSLTYALRYSHTGGRTWQPLGFNLKETELEVDFDSLPGGVDCRLSVMATDGVNTTVEDSEPFSVPVKACLAMILSPENEATFAAGEPVPLRGQGFYLEENEPETEELAWDSSKDGDLGRGMSLEVPSLSPGHHQITLTTGLGERVGQANVTIHITTDD
jgi:hypothetical protein